MGPGHQYHARRDSLCSSFLAPRPDYHDSDPDLIWPFGKLEGIDRDDVRETATSNNNGGGDGGGSASGSKPNGVVTTPTSRVKRALGLKMLKRSPSRRMVSGAGNGGWSSPSSPNGSNSSGSPGYRSPCHRRGRGGR
ncbi:uncharacterized protein Pyn_25663 [Prunus yedoensis var. nudiflora]|uniref:Uncharacterized protein n=1 Tax=Prunus yedoensis var. nudiflora TaxID=2094558 RepID=A0A314ZCF7_PRUYE|nr:uncharacterized protein Pyn_25663 [Prunus yedoensis var. nudiflora]